MGHTCSKGFAALFEKLKEHKFFGELLTVASLKQFSRYSVVGILSAVFEYSLFYVSLKVVKIEYVLSNVIVYALIFWFNFLFNRYWSFKSKVDLKKQLVKYAILFIFNITLTTSALYLLTDILNIAPLISKAVVMCMIVPWNFMIYKKVIYK